MAVDSDLDGLTVADADSDFLASAGNQIRTQAEVRTVLEPIDDFCRNVCASTDDVGC